MLQNLLAEMKTNARLRWGLACIIGLFWFYGILLLRDEVQLAQNQYQGLLKNITRSSALETQKEWPERLPPAKLQVVQMESTLWQAATQGLAQAGFQDWLNTTLVQAAISRPKITMTTLDENDVAGTPPDLWKIKAKIEFDFSPASFMDWLQKIEAHDKQIVVESLVVRKEPIPRAELVFLAYFQKPAAVAAPANAK